MRTCDQVKGPSILPILLLLQQPSPVLGLHDRAKVSGQVASQTSKYSNFFYMGLLAICCSGTARVYRHLSIKFISFYSFIYLLIFSDPIEM